MRILSVFLLFISISLSVLPTLASADANSSMRRQLFLKLDESFEAAREARTDILAPKGYQKALKYYQSADKRFYQKRGLPELRKDIALSEGYLREAMDTTRIAAVTFSAAMQARSNAESANAAKYATETWLSAEKEFLDATLRLEGGNVKSARKAAAKAAPLFVEAELLAIKENYLSGARDLIKRAKKLRADRYATKTLIDAEQLLTSAEKELTENRYDTDFPRDLARRARNEAQHAITITKLAIGVKEKDFSVEDIISTYEKPLSTISGELNLVASLHDGTQETEKNILQTVSALQKKAAKLDQCLIVMEERDAEVASLSAQLGIKSEKLAAEERFRALLADIEGIFDPKEAQIFRQEKNMIIRMIGLNFDSNKSELKNTHLVMLGKVKQAITLSKSEQTTIEGHTDSHGGDASNLSLSEERAAAVIQYLVANMTIDSKTISAVGYGETRPIANNETVEGRAKNRRIDVVIKLVN